MQSVRLLVRRPRLHRFARRPRRWPLTEVSCELEATPLVRSGTPLVTSLSESGSPGDSTPQHLPPMGFLNPTTVCSSEQRACLVSYRHHLWGSKSGNRATGEPGAAWAGGLRGARPTLVAPRMDNSSNRGHSPSMWLVRDGEHTNQVCLLRSCRHVTHQHPREQRRWEAGPSTDQTKTYSIIMMRCVSSLSGNTPRYPNRRYRSI